jgi:hypothetical protein
MYAEVALTTLLDGQHNAASGRQPGSAARRMAGPGLGLHPARTVKIISGLAAAHRRLPWWRG